MSTGTSVTARVVLTAVLLLALMGSAAAQSLSVCETAAAQAVREAREQAMANKAETLQDVIYETTGADYPDAAPGNCIQRLMESGVGASISLPTLSGIVGAVIEKAEKLFCDAVEAEIDRVDDTIDEVTEPVDSTPGVGVDGGVGPGEDGDVDVDYEDYSDEVLDGLYR